jgi:hypothetical protein
MNRIMQCTVGAAIAAAASSGASAAMGDIWSGGSDIVLWVQAVNGSGTPVGQSYAFDTGLTVSSVFGSTFTSNANLVALTGPNTSFASIGSGATTLSSFMSAATTAGDSIAWGVEGGFYTGSQAVGALNSNTKTTGAAEAIFTSSFAPLSTPNGVSQMTGGSLNNLLNGFANGGPTPPTGAGAVESLVTLTANASGTSTSGTWTGGDQAHFGVVGNAGIADYITQLGTAVSLYGVTGNSPASGASSALLQSYTFGTVMLSSTGVLTFGPGSGSVPLPGAVWLFGSGLLGLLGVSRRRTAA